jgi:hypothetical protein
MAGRFKVKGAILWNSSDVQIVEMYKPLYREIR